MLPFKRKKGENETHVLKIENQQNFGVRATPMKSYPHDHINMICIRMSPTC